ncbi:MAG: hypothetical protein AAFZ17_01860 [Cyanobacteria bacterium J06650_10]
MNTRTLMIASVIDDLIIMLTMPAAPVIAKAGNTNSGATLKMLGRVFSTLLTSLYNSLLPFDIGLAVNSTY